MDEKINYLAVFKPRDFLNRLEYVSLLKNSLRNSWICYDKKLEKFIFVKHSNHEQGALLQEAELFKKLKSQYFPVFLDYLSSEESQSSVLLLEYIQGFNLFELKTLGFDFPKPLISKIINQTMEALSLIHSLGFVHNDVKPSNLLIDQMENVKLVDLGSSQRAGDPVVVSTPKYSKPDRKFVNFEDDFYSLRKVVEFIL